MSQMTDSHEQLELSEEVSRHLLGTGDNNGLNLIRGLADVSARARGNQLYLDGCPERIKLIKKFIEVLAARLKTCEELDPFEMRRLFDQFAVVSPPENVRIDKGGKSPFPEILSTHSGRVVRAKTFAQQNYIDAVIKNHITIARGPAGTGKTYLAAALAVRALKEKKVSKVIISKPVVEAGESLGYLPGDLKEKVDPHFKPLYDALQEFVGIGKFEQLLRQGVIEITPLAYMRGRTFNEAFVVIDEAQNTSLAQMRMVLTRIGYGSRMVITGDQTQIDLPRLQDSSLLKLNDILKGIESIEFIDLTDKDVIRHEIVGRIIRAFDHYTVMQKTKP